MIKITNRAQFDAQARRWLGSVRGAGEAAAVGLAYRMLQVIVQNGPQYSGDFVANWNFSVGSPDFTFVEGAVGMEFKGRYTSKADYWGSLRKQGDPEAIDMALGKFKYPVGFKLGQRLYLANGATHDEPYAMLIENNQIKFRPENPSGGRVVAKALQSVGSKYKFISHADVISLSKVGV